MIQDRMFNPDGSLHYPTIGMTATIRSGTLTSSAIYHSSTAWPIHSCRLNPGVTGCGSLNGSQSRFFNLRFEATTGILLPFSQIGSDGGLLSAGGRIERLLLAPAERADLVIDFSAVGAGELLTLRNDALPPIPSGGRPAIDEIMQFRVEVPFPKTIRRASVSLSLPPSCP